MSWTQRAFDFAIASVGLLVVSPVLAVAAVAVKLEDRGPVFYRQTRVGQWGVPFQILKFRTMYAGSDRAGQLTVGARDPRVTRVGYWLRKYKIDELPQLANVWLGSMAMVGPRPEVPRYVALLSEEQKHVLDLKPGITDPASILFANESEQLGQAADPEQLYVDQLLPAKVRINLNYGRDRNVFRDAGLILLTVLALIPRLRGSSLIERRLARFA
jgi:lipopolysaccharide/colanic/teichoic acid biosynthesis glycosyltransferase